ncbi:MAG: hypothetical protein ACC612_08225 [Methanomethylovorans sp.]|uniref:hypothetical protein n=1 Tax=Methanomethylovorans sp. TaxID=2758717 RepID=UPI0035306500
MANIHDRTKSNLYGIKGLHNVHSWNGLAIHIKNSSRVQRCEFFSTCKSNRKSNSCNFSIKRQDAIYMLASEFNVTLDLAEKLIDTLLDMGNARALRCVKNEHDPFDEGTRMLVFYEEL